MTAQATPLVHEEDEGARALLGRVFDHVQTLIRLEVDLAKEEARHALSAFRRGLALFASGILLAALSLQVLTVSLVAGLAIHWPLWVAAAVVGAALAVLAAVLVKGALKHLSLDVVRPSATLRTLQETKEWLTTRR